MSDERFFGLSNDGNGMRGDKVFRVYGLHRGREKDTYMSTFRTPAEAAGEIARLNARERDGRNWASQYHDQGFEVREFTVDTDFEPPPRPKPRDRYYVEATPKPNAPGTWDSTVVRVFERGRAEALCEYERNYALLSTFEPFRQNGRPYALISHDYTATAVLDLVSGQIVAEEPPSSSGFCPVGFYVPDWLDVHKHSPLPGSPHWNSASDEWPSGDFGFVWGCLWGDDNSWKVQYLDLSRIAQGAIERSERFGYVELATSRWRSPCFSAEPPPEDGSDAPDFVAVWRHEHSVRALFHVEMEFDLASGKPAEWQRLGTPFD